MNRYLYLYKKIVFIILFILLYAHAPYMLFLLFPGLLLILPEKKNYDLFETLSFSVFSSISFWIVSFWILKYLAVSFSVFYLFILICSITLFLIFEKIEVKAIYDKKGYLFILYILILSAPLLPILKQQSAPSGGDMATHTYIARLIYEKNSFPQTPFYLYTIKRLVRSYKN